MPPRCPCPNPGTWDYPVCGERTLRQGDCPGFPGWTQPHHMKFFWLQKTKQMVQDRLYPLSLTLKMEDGGPGAKPRNVAAARSWEGPSVYSRQENGSSALPLQGNESLPAPARHLTPQANNHPEGAGDRSSPRTSRKEGSRLGRTSDLQSCNNFCCLSH